MESVHYDEKAGRFVARLQERDYLQLDQIIERYRDKPGFLIPALKDAQSLFGFLPMEVQRYLGKGLKISPSHIYGVVTFYAFFTTVPRGRHVADIVKKMEESLSIKVGETTRDLSFSLEVVRCVGACGLAPVMFVDDDAHTMLQPEKIEAILHKY
jgi:NADH:ubiquinone oxidoreductase subunit E